MANKLLLVLSWNDIVTEELNCPGNIVVEYIFRLHLFFMVKNDQNCDFITTDWQLKRKTKKKKKKKEKQL